VLESQARFPTLFSRFAVNASLVVASVLFFAILVELGLRFFHPVYEAVAGSDTLQQKFLESESNEDLARSVKLFQHIMERWRDAVESSGAEFHVVLLPTGREELFKAALGEKFRVISLLDLFNGAGGSFEWRTIQFKQDGHWAEEGNRLAALHLYKVLAADFGPDASQTANPEQSLVGYYSAFENGWMPKDAAATDFASPEERSRIRDKYIALELRRQARRLSTQPKDSVSLERVVAHSPTPLDPHRWQ